jgi:XTP/dITP diphosphohydrolase
VKPSAFFLSRYYLISEARNNNKPESREYFVKIILSTRNPSKAEQNRAVFRGLPITILTLEEARITGDAIEDGRTLKENALKKAIFAHEQAEKGVWTMADDTGLFIDALGGEPGIRASRWAGERASTAETTRYALSRLEGMMNRSATFETVVALVSPDAKEQFFFGNVKGSILTAPRCEPQPKMPYSSIFVPEGEDKVWAEMTVEYENRISHRGKAFGQVRAFIEGILSKK